MLWKGSYSPYPQIIFSAFQNFGLFNFTFDPFLWWLKEAIASTLSYNRVVALSPPTMRQYDNTTVCIYCIIVLSHCRPTQLYDRVGAMARLSHHTFQLSREWGHRQLHTRSSDWGSRGVPNREYFQDYECDPYFYELRTILPEAIAHWTE